jgi:VIT1/CCC1 family predicted Fe2+/Mn2+ transporter
MTNENKTAPDPGDAPRYRANLQGEIDGAAVYTALAESEQNPEMAEVFRRLAAVEQAHAAFWRKRLAAVGGSFSRSPTLRARMLAWLARHFGPSLVLPTIAAGEARDSAAYDDQADAKAAGLPADEHSHALLMREAAGKRGLQGSFIATLEGRHRGGSGNALRAAVLGANDGLVSNLSLVMGVAGATAADNTILLTGLAGLVAGACSMAMGEWLSVTSSRELFEKQIATEAAELMEVPEEEKEELVLIYRSKGIDEPQARALAERLLTNKDTALDTLAREELGIDPKELGGSPWEAAASSFVLFAVGAIFPVTPFLVWQGSTAVIASLAFSGIALALIGAATTLFTGRHPLFSAVRQLLIGYAAAGVTYGLGVLAGATLG